MDELVLRDRDTNGNGTLDERLYALHDANYNVTALVNASGAVVQRFWYESYGHPEVLSDNWQTAADGYDWEVRYAGYRWDAETGLYQVRNRYLHPRLGRWVQQDPLGYVDGLNLYEYVGSSPLIGLDPLGLYRELQLTALRMAHRSRQRARECAQAGCMWDALRFHILAMRFQRLAYDPDLLAGGYLPGEIGPGFLEQIARQLVTLHPIGRAGLTAIDATIAHLSGEGIGMSDIHLTGPARWPGGGQTAMAARQQGSIYRVPGSSTPSGRPYIGRHNQPNPAQTRRSPDGRDRTQAVVVDRYDPQNIMQGRRSEQHWIDRYGLDNLDNKRNEIAP